MADGYDPYENPSFKPYVGSFTWVPAPKSGIGGDSPGPSYTTLIIDRGAFRNDQVVLDGAGSITATFEGDLESPEGSEEYPVIEAFRPLARPSLDRGFRPSQPFIAKGAGLQWTGTLTEVSRLSAVTLVYRLTVQPGDPDLLPLLNEEDQGKVQDYLKDPTGNALPDIDFTKCIFGQVIAVGAGDGTSDEFPSGDPSELQLTGFTGHKHDLRTLTVRFGDDSKDNPEDFAFRQAVQIKNRYGLTTLRLELQKIMLFDAERVNLRKDQLPCALIQYAYEVKFGFEPSSGTALWPNSGIEPTFHLKLYCPDDRTNPRGFAHSVILRFLIFSIPAIGLAPGDNSSLAGLLDQIGSPRAYFVSFIGPRPGRKNLRFTALARPFNPQSPYVVPMDAELIDSNTAKVILEKYSGDIVASPPPDGAAFDAVYEIDMARGQQFAPDGPLVSPFLYLDATGKITDWYRMVQRLKNGSEFRSKSYRGSLYTERNWLRMESNPVFSKKEPVAALTRRIKPVTSFPNEDPLGGEPVALFISADADPLLSPQIYGPGKWSVKFRASTSDKDGVADTHLIARIWMVPFEEANTATPERLQQFRATGEMHFESASEPGEKSKLVTGTPTDISQVMVSPPLTSELTDIEMIRYIEPSGSSGTLSFPGGGQKMVVGIYPVSVRASSEEELPEEQAPYSPTYSLEVNPDFFAVETTLLITQSHTLFPVQWYRYDASQYQPYTNEHPYGSMDASRDTVGGGEAGEPDEEYAKYDSKLAPFGGAGLSASSGLLALRQRDEPAETKVYIPLETVPTEDTKDVSVYADFATDGKTLAGGKVANKRTTTSGVEPGRWRVAWTVNEDSDNEAISYSYRVEGLLFTTDGRIVERVFRSEFVPHELGTTDYSFEYEVQIPFTVRGEDTQFALRFYAFPFSADGTTVDLESIQSSMGDKPVGVRIDTIAVQEHTLERLNIQQNESFIGSPAFYENMPVVPPRSIGAEEFWYIAWDENLKFMIGFPGTDVPIQGTMYSPAWFSKLPRGMEATVRAPSLRIPVDVFARQLWVRTVPTDEEGEDVTSVDSVSASQNPRSGEVHVGFGGTPEDDPEGDPVAQVLRHSPSHTSPVDRAQITGKAGAPFKGSNASITHLPTDEAHPFGDWLTVVSQSDESEGAVFNAATSVNEGQSYYRPNADLTDDDFTKLSRLAAGLQLPAVVGGVDGRTYVAGWAEPGAVLVRQCHLLQSTESGEGALGENYLVDGSSDVELPFGQSFISPPGGANGRCVKSYPGLAPNSSGGADVFYALEGLDGHLIARTIGGDVGSHSRAHVAITLRQGGVQASSDLAILHPSAGADHALGVTYVAFWSSHRIFLAAYHPNMRDGSVPAEIILVAGDTAFDNDTNPANPAMANLLASGHMLVLRSDSEGAVPEQRCGVTVFQDGDRSSQVGVYYKDAQGDLVARYVTPGVSVTKPMKLV